MASIFKLRRGSGSVSPTLTDGELYINYDSSLQYVSGSSTYTVLPLDKQISGDITLTGSIELSGSITASSIWVKNDLYVSGNLYLGNETTDTITTTGEFTSHLVPNPTRTWDLGTTDKVWRNLYANNVSASSLTGSLYGLGDPIAFSTSVDARLDVVEATSSLYVPFSTSVDSRLTSLQSYTASVSTSVGLLQATASYLNTTFSTSVNSRLTSLQSYTASVSTSVGLLQATASYLNTTFSTSVDSRLDTIEITFSTSVDSRLDLLEATASYLNTTFSTSVDSRLDTLEAASLSDDGRLDALEAYSASLKTAVSASGQDLIIYGNLTVQGTQTSLNVNEVFIEDKNITLASGSTTAAAADGAGIHIAGANVTMSWNNNSSTMTLNKPLYVSGELSGSTLNGIGNVTAFSTSVDSRFDSLENFSSSTFNAFSTSVDNRLDVVEATASLYIPFSTSVDSRLDVVEASASLYVPFSTSVNSRLTSLQSYTASVSTSVGLLQSTASYLNTTFSTSVDARLDTIELYTGSVSTSVGLLQATASYLNTTFSTSVDARLDAIEASTASLSSWTGSTFVTFSTSVDSRIDLTEATSSYLNTTFSTSVDARLDGLEIESASFKTFTGSVFQPFSTSVDTRLDNVEYTASLFGGGLIAQLNVINNATASLQLATASLYTFTSSYYTNSSSFDSRLDALEAYSSSLIFNDTTTIDFNRSGNTITANVIGGVWSGSAQMPAGIISGSSQLPSGLVSGSSQLPSGLVSGSSQVLGGTGIWSGSAQMPAGIVSSSSQVLAGTDIHSGSIGNYQFNSIGVGTAASTTAGEIRATGDITAYYSSDIRLKENIVPIPNALEKVNQISGNTYDWKEGYDEVHSHKGNDVGVIAQEIEEILPQIVTNRDSGFKAVQYEKIIPLLIEAIKELSAKVDRLEK